MIKIEAIHVNVPAGEYYIGDPSFAFSYKDWDKICKINHPKARHNIVYEFKNSHFLIISVGGDGGFLDTTGKEYTVESGSLGLVPIEIVDPEMLDDCKSFGRFITFSEQTLCKSVETELLMFGEILFILGGGYIDDYGFWEIY